MRFALLACFALSGCVTTPVVSAYNGDSVAIQGPSWGVTAPTDADAALAQQTCANKQLTAKYASTRRVGEYQQEHLFLCL